MPTYPWTPGTGSYLEKYLPELEKKGRPVFEGLAAAGGVPTWIISLALGLLGSSNILGGEEKKPWEDIRREDILQMERLLKAMGLQKPYRSPNIGGVENTAIQVLLNQLMRSGNWGWPGGKQMDLSFLLEALQNVGPKEPGGRVSLTTGQPAPPKSDEEVLQEITRDMLRRR